MDNTIPIEEPIRLRRRKMTNKVAILTVDRADADRFSGEPVIENMLRQFLAESGYDLQVVGGYVFVPSEAPDLPHPDSLSETHYYELTMKQGIRSISEKLKEGAFIDMKGAVGNHFEGSRFLIRVHDDYVVGVFGFPLRLENGTPVSNVTHYWSLVMRREEFLMRLQTLYSARSTRLNRESLNKMCETLATTLGTRIDDLTQAARLLNWNLEPPN